jgi:hypothetical protein
VLNVSRLSGGSISLAALAESGVMFSVVTEDGTILAQSPAVGRNRQRLEQTPTTEIIGRNVTEVFSHELAQERMAIIQRCPTHGKSLAFRSVMWNEQYITHVHPLRLQDGSEQRAIIAIHHRVAGDLVSELYTGSEFFEAEYNEYSLPAALSPREVEVLSMLRARSGHRRDHQSPVSLDGNDHQS